MDTLELIELNINLNIEPQCEFQKHGNNNRAHDDGPARWIIKSRCPSCYVNKTRLACERRRTWAIFNGPVHCIECMYLGDSDEFVISINKL